MAQTKAVARKYAKGLYEACEPSTLAALRHALGEVATVLKENRDVTEMIKNPAVSESDKSAALIAIVELLAAKQTASSENGSSTAAVRLLSNLMRVLVQNHRTAAIEEISARFEEIVARHFKMSQIHISSARALSIEEQQSYEGSLRNQMGPQTEVTFGIEAELLGGMQVKAGDVLIDGSIKTSLQQLRAALLG